MKSLMEKLAVKPFTRVSIVGTFEEDFLKELGERSSQVTVSGPRKDSDIIFFRVEETGELTEVKRLKEYLRSNGALWIIRPKGK